MDENTNGKKAPVTKIYRSTSWGTLIVAIWEDGHKSYQGQISEKVRESEEFKNHGSFPIYKGDDGAFMMFANELTEPSR